jgi:BirA family transcriptional regulator, biotin operon repressor / biotin---[acetyl-CoA-carboxylase] ligase
MAVKRIHLEAVNSTNHYLSDLQKENPGMGEVMVTSDYQHIGKGQGNHQWHSMPGENLLMSLLLFPAFLSASQQFQLSRLASLALIDTLKGLGLSAQIKWPNDILVRGRKVAGILIENGISGKNLSHTIIGIGLNLNQIEFPEFPLEASSVALENGVSCNRNMVMDLVFESLMARYRQLEDGDHPGLEKDYLEHLFMLNRSGEFSSRGERFSGTIRGLSELGELVVEREGKTQAYGFQEISFLFGQARS